MSKRTEMFCDFIHVEYKDGYSGSKREEIKTPCTKSAIATCVRCDKDYCGEHKGVSRIELRIGEPSTPVGVWVIPLCHLCADKLSNYERSYKLPSYLADQFERLASALGEELRPKPKPQPAPKPKPGPKTKLPAEFILVQNILGESPTCDVINGTTLKQAVDEVVSSLPERDQKVLRAYYGLDDGVAKTLKQVGDMWDVTRERIRQIIHKAERMLRHPSRSRKLGPYVLPENTKFSDDSIETLSLSVRTSNILRRANVTTISEIRTMGAAGLLKLRNFGEKALKEVIDKLGERAMGLTTLRNYEERENEPIVQCLSDLLETSQEGGENGSRQ